MAQANVLLVSGQWLDGHSSEGILGGDYQHLPPKIAYKRFDLETDQIFQGNRINIPWDASSVEVFVASVSPTPLFGSAVPENIVVHIGIPHQLSGLLLYGGCSCQPGLTQAFNTNGWTIVEADHFESLA